MDLRRATADDHPWDATILTSAPPEQAPRYAGLRMTADEYERLEEDGFKYELIDGVVVMSPSPNFGHQDIAGEIEWQIRGYLKKHPIGRVVRETDVTFNPLRVYRPDLMFLSTQRFPTPTERVHAIPDMILEVVSPATRALDLNTKRDDYQRSGVTEYWLIDPAAATLTFLRLAPQRASASKAPARMAYRPVPCKGTKFRSVAIPGFTLNVSAVKKLMREHK